MTSLIISTPYKIGEQLFADDGQDGFRMELNAFDRISPVTQSHDDAVCSVSADLQTGRNVRDNQRVIARCGKALRNSTENGFAIMDDRARLPMHQRWSAHHFATKYFADSLMSEANAENRSCLVKILDDLF